VATCAALPKARGSRYCGMHWSVGVMTCIYTKQCIMHTEIVSHKARACLAKKKKL
jgi:hypothetical protein